MGSEEPTDDWKKNCFSAFLKIFGFSSIFAIFTHFSSSKINTIIFFYALNCIYHYLSPPYHRFFRESLKTIFSKKYTCAWGVLHCVQTPLRDIAHILAFSKFSRLFSHRLLPFLDGFLVFLNEFLDNFINFWKLRQNFSKKSINLYVFRWIFRFSPGFLSIFVVLCDFSFISLFFLQNEWRRGKTRRFLRSLLRRTQGLWGKFEKMMICGKLSVFAKSLGFQVFLKSFLHFYSVFYVFDRKSM